jgi:hypothetical protein
MEPEVSMMKTRSRGSPAPPGAALGGVTMASR